MAIATKENFSTAKSAVKVPTVIPMALVLKDVSNLATRKVTKLTFPPSAIRNPSLWCFCGQSIVKAGYHTDQSSMTITRSGY